MNINVINSGILAYLGDSVYELEIRNYLIKKGINIPNKIQSESKKYVSATSQAKILDNIFDILTEEEKAVVKRGRNYKPNSKPKNTDITTYKKATSLEALFGFLYLINNKERINEIMKVILGD